MDGWIDGWMDGWMDEWMYGWMDGWMDEWMDGWMDGWMYVRHIHHILTFTAENPYDDEYFYKTSRYSEKNSEDTRSSLSSS